eukprot:1163121-Amphidinium_carterae.1
MNDDGGGLQGQIWVCLDACQESSKIGTPFTGWPAGTLAVGSSPKKFLISLAQSLFEVQLILPSSKAGASHKRHSPHQQPPLIIVITGTHHSSLIDMPHMGTHGRSSALSCWACTVGGLVVAITERRVGGTQL